jgi:hypothetical protein
MDTDDPLGNGTSSGWEDQPPRREDADFRFGRPIPSVRRDGDSEARTLSPRSRSREAELGNLAASFPLFFFGAGCIAVATFVLFEGSHAAIGRIPLWVPFVALGIIALAGGTLSIFAEPDEPSAGTGSEKLPRGRPSSRVRSVTANPPTRPQPRTSSPAPRVTPRIAAAPKELADSRPAWSEEPAPSRAETPSVSSATVVTSTIAADDTASLLKEIDAIEADIHASRSGGPGGPSIPAPVPRPSALPTRVPVALPRVAASGTAGVPKAVAPTAPARLESEVPHVMARCAGCGSVILQSGTPSRCQVCGEPLCSECRDRSLAEGKPNLCPLCGLLDSVHSKGSPAPQARRSRS